MGQRVARFLRSFVIDPDRTIQYAWRSESADDMPELTEVQKATDCHGDRWEVLPVLTPLVPAPVGFLFSL